MANKEFEKVPRCPECKMLLAIGPCLDCGVGGTVLIFSCRRQGCNYSARVPGLGVFEPPRKAWEYLLARWGEAALDPWDRSRQYCREVGLLP